MNTKVRNKTLDSILFCTSSIGIIAIIPIIYKGKLDWIGAFFQLFVTLYFLKKKSPLFGHSLFFLLLSLILQIPLTQYMWIIHLLIASTLYLIILFSFKSLKRSTNWLQPGHINKTILFWIIYIICLSSAALILWTSIIHPTTVNYKVEYPNLNILIIILGIIGFSVLNGTLEEFVFRGIFFNGLDNIFNRTIITIFIQAVFFGLLHFEGFPGGALGIGLSTGYGLVLGILRNKSHGLVAPILVHIFTDITIGIILLEVIGRI